MSLWIEVVQQLLDLIIKDMDLDYLIVRGDNLKNDISSKFKDTKEIPFVLFSEKDELKSIINKLYHMDGHLVIGIGNIVGWGETFITQIRNYIDDYS